MKSAPPFFFPTTVLLVDDNVDFMGGCLIGLDVKRARYQLHSDPISALQSANSNAVKMGLPHWSIEGDANPIECNVHVNVAKAQREVFVNERFDRISVVVTDYHMPGMNGIEFLSSIKDPHIQKILLTGFADEKLAVDALQSGIIHRYIRKQDDGLVQKLNTEIFEAQKRYFCSLGLDILVALKAQSVAPPLQDPDFATFLFHHMETIGAVEYYLRDTQGNFIFIDANGKKQGLCVALGKASPNAKVDYAENAYTLTAGLELGSMLEHPICSFNDSVRRQWTPKDLVSTYK
jgi:CheY-like chemotaxis protein